MFILRERIRKADRDADRKDLLIIPVPELTEAEARLAKIGGHLKSKTMLTDSCLGSDGATCYEVVFALQAVTDSGAWEEIPRDLDTLRRIFQMKIEGTPIEIEFRRSDGRIEGEYFLAEKPALL